jgi:hypothetical protein
MGVSEDNDIVLHTGGGGYELATAHEIRRHVNLIQEVIKGVFKADTHYGIIPGCKQKSLYKAGAEKILATFRIAVDPEVEDLSTPDEVRYRVRVKGFTPDGRLVGVGIGECSSNEDKYAWRAAVSDAEFKATDELRRRVKYYTNGGTVNQVRTNPADVANTVLKMGKKRGMIDLTLTATAASDVFTQDIEDLPEEYVESIIEPKAAPQPRRTPKPATSDAQIGAAPVGEPAKQETGDVCGIVESVTKGALLKSGQQLYKIGLKGEIFGTTKEELVARATASKELQEAIRLPWKLFKGYKYAENIVDLGDLEKEETVRDSENVDL